MVPTAQRGRTLSLDVSFMYLCFSPGAVLGSLTLFRRGRRAMSPAESGLFPATPQAS